jgi:hypothetical protein
MNTFTLPKQVGIILYYNVVLLKPASFPTTHPSLPTIMFPA